MAPETSKWLSFSLSPMEMLTSTQPQPHHHHHHFDSDAAAAAAHDSHHDYYLDNFYANGWENGKTSQGIYAEDSTVKQVVIGESIGGDSSSNFFQGFLDSHINTQPIPVPKLEDFLGGESALVRYSDHSQTDTQDSSLTHIYDQHHGGSSYFNVDPHPQDFKAIAASTGFQAFSTNSGSEVDDSASAAQNQLVCSEFVGQSIESARNELAFSHSTTAGLTLGVTVNNNSTQSTQKALVSVDSGTSCKKITDTFGQRTSIYRGVTRHRWTGRYEAHLWDNSCRREGQARKGRQVYLGGYDKEDKAARAYDLAALKYWGPTATTNFPVSHYTKELEEMNNVTKQEFIASLRRKSSGFSRGASIYRGVTRHHQQGRWQARIGRVAGNKDLYLGTFATEEEAAEAYDIAAIKFRGVNAVTNFEMNRYDVEAIMNSALPIGGAAKRLKLSLETEQKQCITHDPHGQSNNSGTSIDFSTVPPLATIPCGVPYDSTTRYHHNLFNLHSNNLVTSDPPGSTSTMVAPMTFLPPSAEFFFWPHQSY